MSGKPPIRRQSNLEQMLLIGVSVLLGTTLLLWLTGEIGGFLHAGGTWPKVSLSEMGAVMGRLFRHPADPARVPSCSVTCTCAGRCPDGWCSAVSAGAWPPRSRCSR